MARVSGVIRQIEVRNLAPADRETHLSKVKDSLASLHGPGAFITTTEPNGDISYTYDYDPAHTPAEPGFELTDAEISAIDHAKVFVANSAQIKQNPDTGLYEALNEEALKADPAMAGRITTLNVLVSLLARIHGQPLPTVDEPAEAEQGDEGGEEQ